MKNLTMELKMVPNTKEWLEFRKTGIGASDAPIIMGDSPYTTITQLWEQKVGLAEGPPMNEYMQRGHDLEPLARELFINKMIHHVEPIMTLDPDNRWRFASMDGISINRKIAVEIKTVGKKDFEDAEKGIVPRKYQAQLQHQMDVNNIDSMYYMPCLCEKNDMGKWVLMDYLLITVHRDKEYCKELLEKEKAFYECIKNFTPPEDESAYEHRIDEEWDLTIQLYRTAKEKADQSKKEMDELKKKLVEMANGKNSKSDGAILYKSISKGTVDYSSVPELKGINLDQYRKKPTEYFRISRT